MKNCKRKVKKVGKSKSALLTCIPTIYGAIYVNYPSTLPHKSNSISFDIMCKCVPKTQTGSECKQSKAYPRSQSLEARRSRTNLLDLSVPDRGVTSCPCHHVIRYIICQPQSNVMPFHHVIRDILCRPPIDVMPFHHVIRYIICRPWSDVMPVLLCDQVHNLPTAD